MRDRASDHADAGGHRRAPAFDVRLVLGERVGEGVGPVAAGDEEEERHVGGGERGAQRGLAGRGDRGGRQAGCGVGVPGGGRGEVFAGQFGLPPAVQRDSGGVAGDGVLHGRVDLERHTQLDAVPEHGGDDRSLLVDDGFALDDRGDREHLVQRTSRVGDGVEQLGSDDGVEALEHQADDLVGADAEREVVGGGEEVALEPDAGRAGRGERAGAVLGAAQGG